MWMPSRSPLAMSLCSTVTAEPGELPVVSSRIFEFTPLATDFTG